jgi:oligopeptidase B
MPSPLTDRARRRFLVGAGATALLVATEGPARAGAALPTPPVTPRVPLLRHQLGRTRDDPYAWLKYVPPQGQRDIATMPSAIRDHLLAENAYAGAVLDRVATAGRRFLAALDARAPVGGGAPDVTRGGWTYSVDEAAGAHPRYTRRRTDTGDIELLLDENERAHGQAYYRTTGQQVSPDGRLYAWAEDVGGNDRHRLCVRDLASGAVRVVVDTDAYGYGGLVFSPSSRWLFWIWRTAADGFVAITLSGPDTSEVRLVAAEAEERAPALVRPRAPGRRYTIDEWDGALIALIEDEQAIDGRVARLDRRSFAETKTLVPHRAGTQILQLVPFRRTLAWVERRDTLPRLMLLAPGGTAREVAFAGDAYALTVPGGQDYAAPTCRATIETPAAPPRWVAVDLASARVTTIATQRFAGYDPTRFTVRRLYATAPDGDRVPITVLTRRGARADGRSPLLLYGYGAYGVSSEALFDVAPTVLVEQGWTYAIAHVRGGAEKGRRWFLDGRRHHKRNSFTDFIACAQHLAATGHAARDRIVSYGLSAGGLLVGGAMNLAPALWAGVIATVPFVDMLNTMSDADHPLVPLFRPDWGDPLSNAADYDYMLGISPYENVRPAPYPPLFTTAGLKDDRVGYWEPAKLVAAVRAASTARAPALLLTDLAAGHQGSAGRDSVNHKMARLYAFAQGCVDGSFA